MNFIPWVSVATMVQIAMHFDFMYVASSGLCISCMKAHLWVYKYDYSFDNTKPNIYNYHDTQERIRTGD